MDNNTGQTAQIELPRYQSHKKVWALKIKTIARHDDGTASLVFTYERYASITVPLDYMTKHDPQPGGYYVVYEDGYRSFSPAEAFEGGYTLIARNSAPVPQPNARLTAEDVARICHDLNLAYCEAIDDHTQKAWPFAPEWQQQSAINGVKFHMQGDHGPEASHNAWLTEKQADGWVYGEVKNPEAKTHPCMVPFDQLPIEQQIKDVLFSQTVRALRPLLGVTS